MSETVKTILAVAVLTAALWVWADLEQPAEPEEVVPVRVKVPAEDYVVRSIVPEQVTVKLKGPRGAIQELRALPDEMACKFDLTEADLKGPRVVLHARDGFRHWAARRIVVTECKSEHDGVVDGDIVVRVDHMIRVKVRVEPKVTGAVATATAAQPPACRSRSGRA
jgi:hypothetical protein